MHERALVRILNLGADIYRLSTLLLQIHIDRFVTYQVPMVRIVLLFEAFHFSWFDLVASDLKELFTLNWVTLGGLGLDLVVNLYTTYHS